MKFDLLDCFKQFQSAKIIDVTTSKEYTYNDFYSIFYQQSELIDGLKLPKFSIIVIYGFRNPVNILLMLFSCIKSNLIPYVIEQGNLDQINELNYRAIISQDKINSQGLEFNTIINTYNIYNVTSHDFFIGQSNNLMIISSSGSTSKIPKKILIGKKETISNIISNLEMLPIRKSDTTLIMLPITYSYGLIAQFFSHVYQGANIVFVDKTLSILQLPTLLQEYNVTNFFITPLTGRLILYYNKMEKIENKLKFISIGGDKLQIETLNQLLNKFNTDLYTTYGLAEAGPRVATKKNEGFQKKNLSIGSTANDINLEILKDEKYQKLYKLSDIGYLKINTPSIYQGYIIGKELISSCNELITKDIVIKQNNEIEILGRDNEYLLLRNKILWFSDLLNTFYEIRNILKVSIKKNLQENLIIKVYHRGHIDLMKINETLFNKYQLRENINYNITQIKFNNKSYK